jgi:hypothetical protein
VRGPWTLGRRRLVKSWMTFVSGCWHDWFLRVFACGGGPRLCGAGRPSIARVGLWPGPLPWPRLGRGCSVPVPALAGGFRGGQLRLP